MKRILLSLICCSPLLFTTPVAESIELIGPSDEVPVLEQYGPISSTETLWAISTKLRPDTSVSVYQTLVAIYKLNPYAFKDGDVNKIIPFSVLNVPSTEFIANQTNQEAYRLLKPKSTSVVNTNPVEKTQPVTKTVDKVEKKTVEKTVSTADPQIVEQLQNELANRDKALLEAEKLTSEQEQELLLLNDQILEVTESNQQLKVKIQPLMDQISELSFQVDEEIKVQKELQALLEEYKKQIDAFEEPPFSGEGVVNEVLQAVTSSITSLLLTILTPLFLLLALFVIYLRVKSKRELALQEQELAESTAMHMEQAGKFDALLTDDLEETEANTDQIDFTEEMGSASPQVDKAPEVEPQADKAPTQVNSDPDDSISELELDVVDETPEAISLDEVALPEKEEFEELVASEDDPFGIDALVDEESILSDDEGGEPDSLIVENEGAVELSDSELMVADESDQADLDLAAEWEAQLAEGNQDESVDLDSVGEGESLQENEQDSEVAEQSKKLDNESLDSEIESLVEQDVPDQQEELSEDIQEPAPISEQLTEEDTTSETTISDDIEDLSEFENVDISSLKSVDDTLSELDAELQAQPEVSLDELDESGLEETGIDDDILAKQLSETAFNEDVPLPTVDKDDSEGFIDIETLLEDSQGKEITEEEFDLELGLDEFPDVVNAANEFDSDENGVSAQLDLARAYLEIDEKKGAKDILTGLLDSAQGNELAEIKKLLDKID